MSSSTRSSSGGGDEPRLCDEEKQPDGPTPPELSDPEKGEGEYETVTRQDGGGHVGASCCGTAPILRQEEQQPGPEALTRSTTLNRVLSAISTSADLNAGPPPNGGRKAWLMCICGHFIVMDTWGFINSFGVFQTYYASQLGRSPADVSWIGSLQIFLTFFGGTFAGRAVDAGFLVPVLALGTALTALGIFTTSAATQYWQLLLSQGLCMGLGSGCLFCAAISTVASYFTTRRSFAIGIAATGSATGGVIFPVLARELLPRAGFPWTVRAMGLVQLATLAFVVAAMRSRLPPRRADGKLVDWPAFADPAYTLFAAGMFFNFWGAYFGFYYLAAYARSTVAGVALGPGGAFSYEASLDLLLVANAAGLPGRLVPALLADRWGPVTVLTPVCLSCGVILLAWAAVRSPAGLYVWAAAFGLTSGAIQGLFPAAMGGLTAADPVRQGTRIGMVFTIVSFAVLTGNPIAGALIAAEGGRYGAAQAFTGASLLVGTALICAARWARMRRSGEGWKVKI
ncbi:major facilitator superfamily domain-containing protein [Biscogniauxia mediterranea]|nr:major facilitator superfamily domain-containing protein [Biscogniauxia mediterranea]